MALVVPYDFSGGSGNDDMEFVGNIQSLITTENDLVVASSAMRRAGRITEIDIMLWLSHDITLDAYLLSLFVISDDGTGKYTPYAPNSQTSMSEVVGNILIHGGTIDYGGTTILVNASPVLMSNLSSGGFGIYAMYDYNYQDTPIVLKKLIGNPSYIDLSIMFLNRYER